MFQFICSGANHHGENTDTVKIDENYDPVCCENVDLTHSDGFSDKKAQRFFHIGAPLIAFFGIIVSVLGIYFKRRSNTNRENQNEDQSENISLNEDENNEVHIDINDGSILWPVEYSRIVNHDC